MALKLTPALAADVASADLFDVMLDATGTIWVRSSDSSWAYVTEDGITDFDIRATLPDEYAPTSASTPPAPPLVLRGINAA